LLLALASAVILRTESRGTHDHILLSQILDSPILVGQVPVFISLRNRVAQLYPQGLGFFRKVRLSQKTVPLLREHQLEEVEVYTLLRRKAA
jgi:hypothetical protein